MYPNPDVQEVVEALAAGIREALGAGPQGLYLRGSLALGDFDPASSDIDLLAVTRAPVTGAEFAALSAVHSRVQALDNPYAAEVELAYVPLELLANFVPKTRVPALERGRGGRSGGRHWAPTGSWSSGPSGTTARREMLGHAGLARFAVETMCRALRWALGRWPGWASLLEHSRAWKAGQPASPPWGS